ncbi:MAG TPA: PstS family phosphate ABC transporter substrate-binding protein, partial [Longimicrobiales bacterium]
MHGGSAGRRLTLAVVLAAGGLVGCGPRVEGSLEVDGSSTVFPITEAVAEEFVAETTGRFRVTVGLSGTGGGFQRFCAGETAVSNASRPIKESELEACRRNGVEPLELPVAYDGLAVVVNPANTFVECLTVEELKRIWEPGSRVSRWSDVRAGFPDAPIRLFGPGTSSGTFDYFTEVIVGEEDASRPDYTASEDDNVLIQGVAGEPNALGYFGYAYYAENQDALKLVAVDGGEGCVRPTPETIRDGTYRPLSRPLLIYVNRRALAEPAVVEFVRFYMENAAELVPETGYVPLTPEQYQENLRKVEQAIGA